MKDYEQRVVDEQIELTDKLSRLLEFFSTPVFKSLDRKQRSAMVRQAGKMQEYSDILEERLEAMKEE